MSFLRNRVAVITGSSRGLGLAIAESYARAGASVVISSRNGEALEQAVQKLKSQKLKVEGFVCDVRDPLQVEELSKQAQACFGPYDIWINNAAIIGPIGPVVEVPPEHFSLIWETNAMGVYHGSRVALQHFLKHKRGRLINVTGPEDSSTPTPLFAAYTASKAWVRSFTHSIAEEYKYSNIGVFALQPPYMRTALSTSLDVVAPYVKHVAPFQSKVTSLGEPPQVMIQKALWLVAEAPLTKAGTEVAYQSAFARWMQKIQQWFSKLLSRPEGPPIQWTLRQIESAQNKPLQEQEEWEHYW